MAFKMTPGLKGSPSKMFGGECGGAGQPPCPPRFQAEKEVMQNMRVSDRSFDSRSKSAKRKKAIVTPPQQAPLPPKLRLPKLPKGFKFRSEKDEARFNMTFKDLSEFKDQESLDTAFNKFVKAFGGPIAPPIEGPPKFPGGPIFEAPGKGPVFEGPIKEGPINEGKYKAAPGKGVAAVKAK